MVSIKNKDGSVNWDNIKINSVKHTTWGVSTEPTYCSKDAIDEIILFLKNNLALSKKFYKKSDFIAEYWSGVSAMCQDTLDFIDTIIKL